jgi:hypothetical protein
MPAYCAQVIARCRRQSGRIWPLDRQAELKDGTRDDIQQPLRIVGEHIDDREPVADPVINHHLSRLTGRRQPVNIRQAGISTHPTHQAIPHPSAPDDRFGYGSTAVLRGTPT